MRRALKLWVCLSSAMLGIMMPCFGVTVLWKAPSVAIHTNQPYSSLEFENPLNGTEKVFGYRMLEWLDADYSPPNWYDDWTVSHPQEIDGCETEIWMRRAGHSCWTNTTVPSTIISIHLVGDDNDGVAQISVDGAAVAVLDMGTQWPPQPTCVIVSNLPYQTHAIQVDDNGFGASGYGTDVAVLGTAALEEKPIKWEQPPTPYTGENIYYGWNEMSQHEGDMIVADDWVCENTDPITRVTWWGSYIGLQGAVPEKTPDSFHLSIWTDIPAGIDAPFSHPGTCIWATNIPADGLGQFVGWDFDPIRQTYEACFRYEAELPQPFWQEQPRAILWLSIAAHYNDGNPGPNPWGWKTRLRDPSSTAPDGAVKMIPTTAMPGDIFMWGYPIIWPPDGSQWDMAFEMTADRRITEIKWNQPPTTWPTSNTFRGWDEPSIAGSRQIVADDWVCTSSQPITSIQWWGSYPGWQDPTPPPMGPPMFNISIWTDVPAGIGLPFSHPGTCIWQITVPREITMERFAGFDEYPGHMIDACFAYKVDLPQEMWFYQTPGIYWLCVAAEDPLGMSMQWGWKTRLREMSQAPDAAVRTWDPTTPFPGAIWIAGEPIISDLGTWWDTSFQLIGTTIIKYLKWSQPPTTCKPPNTYSGWDEPSIYGHMAADDWVCLGNKPVSDIHWWGSFAGWSYREIPPTEILPSGFHIAIWTDTPAGQGTPFSHPETVIWEKVFDINSIGITFEGWDIDPRDPMMQPEACFRFDLDLPNGDWFYQGGEPPNIYWLSIAAVYDHLEFPPDQVWGWKTRPRVDSLAPDAAVRIFEPKVPIMGAQFYDGYPIWDIEREWDLAFTLTTVKERPGTLTIESTNRIRDHFWWPNPDPWNEMLQVTATADLTEPVRWDTITLQPGGTGDDALDISSVDIWMDNNGNGEVDPTDTLIVSSNYPADDTAVTINMTGYLASVVIPPGGAISVLISYTMAPSASPPETFRFNVIAATGTGMNSGSPVEIRLIPDPIPSALKVVGVRPISIGQAKLAITPGSVLLDGKVVTADFTGRMGLFYIEEEDRSSGIGVLCEPISPLLVGQKVSVYGRTILLYPGGTEVVILPEYILPGQMTTKVPLVGTNNRNSGGSFFGQQMFVFDDVWNGKPSAGLNNIGSLMKLWGRVTGLDLNPRWLPAGIPATPVIWLDDRSGLKDGTIDRLTGKPNIGVAVLLPPGMLPIEPGNPFYWTVTGILKDVPNMGWIIPAPIRLLVPRSEMDFTSYDTSGEPR